MGKLTFISMKAPNKDAWKWVVSSRRDIFVLLSNIAPYLFIKRVQADLLIKYCDDSLAKKSDWWSKEECYLALRRLNRRGRAQDNGLHKFKN